MIYFIAITSDQIFSISNTIITYLQEVSTASKIIPTQESVITETTASLKTIDEKKTSTAKPRTKEYAKTVSVVREGLEVTELTSEDVLPDFKVKTRLDKAFVTTESYESVEITEVRTEVDIQTLQKKSLVTEEEIDILESQKQIEKIFEQHEEKISKEVEEVMEVLQVKDFGPGEMPLRELATIGYLVRNGVTVNEINECLYLTDQFPALKTPDAQNALVQLVEREGHGPLITQVLTEETAMDESVVAATVGFRAFMKMVELQHATVEEIITHFAPDDFRVRAWEITDIAEVIKHVKTFSFNVCYIEILHVLKINSIIHIFYDTGGN